jgi:16S rRNA (uracil1498-N3)-methyltransferase
MPIPDALSLVIGPEGGFSPSEREWMASQPETYAVSLGARVLRTEHAAGYALAQLAALWE